MDMDYGHTRTAGRVLTHSLKYRDENFQVRLKERKRERPPTTHFPFHVFFSHSSLEKYVVASSPSGFVGFSVFLL